MSIQNRRGRGCNCDNFPSTFHLKNDPSVILVSADVRSLSHTHSSGCCLLLSVSIFSHWNITRVATAAPNLSPIGINPVKRMQPAFRLELERERGGRMGRNKGGERDGEIRHLVTESGGALLFLHRFLVDQSPSVTARKKKKRFMHKGFNVFHLSK